jgi:hypothetical protein
MIRPEDSWSNWGPESEFEAAARATSGGGQGRCGRWWTAASGELASAVPHNKVRVRVSVVELVTDEVRRVLGGVANLTASGSTTGQRGHCLGHERRAGPKGQSDTWRLPHGVAS